MRRHLLPEIRNAGVVWPSLPVKLLTVVQLSPLVGASDGGTSTGCGFSTAAGGGVWGLAAGAAGVVEPQATIELADRSTSPM